ncbi:MAG: hypothetical protein L3J78_04470 [Thermoplasmata archaeon]|nr:hypothetical protein [Thermoplasmata archaeon]
MPRLIPKTAELLYNESIRQQQVLSDSRTSIETRASFLLGLQGVILSVFVGVFLTYWTAAASTLLISIDGRAWALGLFLTTATMVSLAVSIVIQVWILLPRSVGVGPELAEAYEVFASHGTDEDAAREAALRSLVTIQMVNEIGYTWSVMMYRIGSLVTVASLVMAVEFVLLQVTLSTGPGLAQRTALVAGLLLTTLLAVGGVVWQTALRRAKRVEQVEAIEAKMERFRDAVGP